MTYEEELIRDAAEKLKTNARVLVVVEKVEERPNIIPGRAPSILMTFKLGKNENHQMLSCEKTYFHDIQKASNLPLVGQLVSLEMASKMSERDFILMCFAAGIYKIGLHYRYF